MSQIRWVLRLIIVIWLLRLVVQLIKGMLKGLE